MISELEFCGEAPIEMAENEIPPNSKEPNEVRAARNREVRQTPQRKPTTQIWQENELPIFKAFCETILSRDLRYSGSISLFPGVKNSFGALPLNFNGMPTNS